MVFRRDSYDGISAVPEITEIVRTALEYVPSAQGKSAEQIDKELRARTHDLTEALCEAVYKHAVSSAVVFNAAMAIAQLETQSIGTHYGIKNNSALTAIKSTCKDVLGVDVQP